MNWLIPEATSYESWVGPWIPLAPTPCRWLMCINESLYQSVQQHNEMLIEIQRVCLGPYTNIASIAAGSLFMSHLTEHDQFCLGT